MSDWAVMNLPFPLQRTVHELFPGIGAELRRLFDSAVENSGLLTADWCTLRDLVDLSDYRDDEPLHALLLVMLAALDEGSLCVEITAERLAQRLADLADADAVANWPRLIVERLRAFGYPALIADAAQEEPASPRMPLVRRPIGDRTFVYFQKQHGHERELTELLRDRLGNAGGAVPGAEVRPILDEVLERRPLQVGHGPLQLNPEQGLAVALAMLRRFVVVSGGPGTGKTSIVLTLLRCLARLPGFDPERVALAAPTGRAAQRLNDSLRLGLETLPAPVPKADAGLHDIAAQTVHRLLGYNPERGTFRHHPENPLALDLVVVDEVSMVGLELTCRLFQAVPRQARLVLLGDKDQLPSVDPGAVLANLVAAELQPGYSPPTRRTIGELFPDLALPEARRQRLADTLVVLEQNHRSAPHIQEIARAVNAQRATTAVELPSVPARDVSFAALGERGGCVRLDGTEDLTRWRSVLRRWAEYHYLVEADGKGRYSRLVEEVRLPAATEPGPEHQAALTELFAALNRARILTLVREGPWGSTGINRFLEQELRRRLDPDSQGRLFAGAAVLVTRNHYDLELFNGDVGLALRSQSGGYRVVFPRRNSFLSLPADALPVCELAFALTVHKAQGSEYERLLLVFPPQGARRLLTKEMVYTGITRARKLAVLCGSVEVLQTAIGRRVEREANLLEF
jgi:exodeoxyribonuclease V alpha subunit